MKYNCRNSNFLNLNCRAPSLNNVVVNFLFLRKAYEFVYATREA